MAAENSKFRPAVHSFTGETTVEVWRDGTLLGVIYPTPNGLKFVSKYITNHPHLVVIDPEEPPAILISLVSVPSDV